MEYVGEYVRRPAERPAGYLGNGLQYPSMRMLDTGKGYPTFMPVMPTNDHIARPIVEDEVMYQHFARIRQLEPQYFPDGVVAWTDAVLDIVEPLDGRKPYDFGATRRHELMHILFTRKNYTQDEAKINRMVATELGLNAFPFASYHDPLYR